MAKKNKVVKKNKSMNEVIEIATKNEIFVENQITGKINIEPELKIDTKDVNVFYGDFQALKDISLSAKPNTITALIGPSGCGKSTYLRLFNRMNDFIENFKCTGSILIDDKEVYDPKINIEKLRKDVGMVFQKPNPFPKSIFDNVAYGLRVHGMTKKTEIEERVVESIKMVALWDEVKNDLKKNALALSGGQQQRLCIARALAVQPEIILMDEPTSALDPISTARIEELIVELRKEFTILIVTHNLQQAGRISDYTGFFYLGELIEYGKTKDIFMNPQNKKTENYITGRFG